MGVWVGPGWPEAGLGTKPPRSPYLELGRRPGARRGDPSGAPSGQWLPPPPSGAGYKGAARGRAPVRKVSRRRERGRRWPSRAAAGPLGGNTGGRPDASPQPSGLPRHKEARESAPSPGLPPPTARAALPSTLTHSSVPQLMAEPEATGAGRLLPRSSRPDFPSSGSARQVSASKAAATTGSPSE